MIEVMEPVNHTGRELELMLAQKKPLAWFTFSEDFDAGLIEEHRLAFEPHVKAGDIVECCFGEEVAFDPRIGRRLKMRTYLYALPGEEWRIPAMRLVLSANASLGRSGEAGPNQAIDRIMGALLGYSEAEIEAYISVGKYS